MQHFLDIDNKSNEIVYILIKLKQFAEFVNINEHLKEHYQMEWVQAMNNIKIELKKLY